MSISIFDGFLTTSAIADVFSDNTVAQAMFRFEAALARAEAAEGVIPQSAASAIANVCKAELHDVAALVSGTARAGSLAIPLVRELTRTVALFDDDAAGYVHWGATSQDVVDTALALLTRDALALIDRDLGALVAALLQRAEAHADTPMLARTLMQPAQVISLGFKLTNWVTPLLRSRRYLRDTARRGLALQFGGSVGTLSTLGDRASAVAKRMAADLGLALPPMPWHTQRDEWVRLGLEVAVLVGSLGKIATDLALLSQHEIGELAEPSGRGRGSSASMPQKRNPVASLAALAAAERTPFRAAALLASMSQEHERGLGAWHAEIAEWPGLLLSAHGAVRALAEAIDGLRIDAERMQRNIDATRGLVFAEAVAMHLARTIGRVRAHALIEDLAAVAERSGRAFEDLIVDAVESDATLTRAFGERARATLHALFDSDAAARLAGTRARERLTWLHAQQASLPAAPWEPSALASV